MGGDGCVYDPDGGDGFMGVYLSPMPRVVYIKYAQLHGNHTSVKQVDKQTDRQTDVMVNLQKQGSRE